jgi:preprotein translocase subunit YajC
MSSMSQTRSLWNRVPRPIRATLSIVFWLSAWLFMFALLQVLIEDYGLDDLSASLVQLLIVLVIGAVGWFFVWRPRADRDHGGREKRLALQLAIRTGEIGPLADRDRLEELVEHHSKSRAHLWIWLMVAVGFGLMVFWPIASSLSNPPIGRSEAFFIASQVILLLILVVPLVLFMRRGDRQMRNLKAALTEHPPHEGAS